MDEDISEKTKRIEVVTKKVSELSSEFGNPRKILRKKRDELQDSLEMFGDFGIIVIDENNNIISGNQRVSVLREQNPDTEVLCKQLIGYTEAEKRCINIKANTHSGDWDIDLLAEWTADLNVDLGIESKEKNPDEMRVKDMELIRYEKYDYVLIVCRNEVDYKNLQRALGIEKTKMIVSPKRKIQARSIWYDDIKAQIVSKDKGDYGYESADNGLRSVEQKLDGSTEE